MVACRSSLLFAASVLFLSLPGCKPADQQESDAPAAADVAVPAAPAPTHRPATAVTHWQCGKLTVATHFDDDSLESITLETPERMLTLKSMANEDGARFADAAGNEFWSRPGKVSLTLVGQPTVECKKNHG